MIIKIKNLCLQTIVGVYEFEQSILRDIVINVEINTDNDLAVYSDNIDDAIDYDKIVEKIKNIVKQNHFKLIERMAGSIIEAIMEDGRVKKCRLEIDKVGAVENLESFSVILERQQN